MVIHHEVLVASEKPLLEMLGKNRPRDFPRYSRALNLKMSFFYPPQGWGLSLLNFELRKYLGVSEKERKRNPSSPLQPF